MEKRHLGRKILGITLLLSTVGISAYELTKRDLALNYFNPSQTIEDRRVQLTSQIMKQYNTEISGKNRSEILKGLDTILNDINNGRYDHKNIFQ